MTSHNTNQSVPNHEYRTKGQYFVVISIVLLSCRFILSALSTSQRNVVNCALCHRALPVFEQFPLVDGTLFLSPSRHDEIEYDVPCHLQG